MLSPVGAGVESLGEEQLEADHNVTRGIHQNKMKFLVMFTRAVKRYINYREGALKEAWSLMKLNVKKQRRKSKVHRKHLIHEHSKKLLMNNRRISQYNRTNDEIGYLMQWMENAKIFPKDIPPEMLRELCEHMSNIVLNKGDALFLQGDTGECFYIIVDGSVRLSWQEDEREALKLRLLRDEQPIEFKKTDFLNPLAVGKTLKELPSGISFGELSMMTKEATQRTCSAIACTNVLQLCVVDRDLYDRTLKTYHLKKGRKDEAFGMLSKMPVFKKWVPEVTKQLVEVGKTRILRNADYISNKDEEIKSVFIVLTGEVASVSDMRRVKRRNSGPKLIQHRSKSKQQLSDNEQELCRTVGGSILGDVEIFHDMKHYVISSVVRSSECSFLEVPLEDFVNLAKINKAVWRGMQEDAKKKMEFLNSRWSLERKKGKQMLKVGKDAPGGKDKNVSLANTERLGIIQKIKLAKDLEKGDKERFSFTQTRKLPAIVLAHRRNSLSRDPETTAKMYERNNKRRPSLLQTPSLGMRKAPTSGSMHSLSSKKPNPYISLRNIVSFEQTQRGLGEGQQLVSLDTVKGISKFKKR
ncbi:hypothetical protein TrST_g5778 [Triparma strigata]|uniref:Cyclic nucleotide-binding domain-containing protein n=1 Tax=Triparma strigata TaxID=1606541 RepID=A0A9W7BXP2_9STRA|nr:hypothetical protein TrST_g5778 [Triparma strigata]